MSVLTQQITLGIAERIAEDVAARFLFKVLEETKEPDDLESQDMVNGCYSMGLDLGKLTYAIAGGIVMARIEHSPEDTEV